MADDQFDLGPFPEPPILRNWMEIMQGFEYETEPGGDTEVITQPLFKEEVMRMSEDLTVAAGYAASLKGILYAALLLHVKHKLLGGLSPGLADKETLTKAYKMLPRVKANFETPGLVAGIIEQENLISTF